MWIRRIYQRVAILSYYRDVFKETLRIIRESKAGASDPYNRFYFFFIEACFVYSVMAIRRQVEIRGDSVSLARLLDDIAACPDVLTRARYRQLWIGSRRMRGLDLKFVRSEADRSWTQFAGENNETIDPEIVRMHLSHLRTKLGDIEVIADRVFAHDDPREHESPNPMNPGPSLGDIDSFIDELVGLVDTYQLLMTGPDANSAFGNRSTEWTSIFKTAWID